MKTLLFCKDISCRLGPIVLTDGINNDGGDTGSSSMVTEVKDMIINKLTSELEHEKAISTRLKNEVDLLKLENENLKNKRARGEDFMDGRFGNSNNNNKRARTAVTGGAGGGGGGMFGGCDIL